MKKFIAQLLGLYTRQEVQLAVEFGVICAETAKGMKIKKYDDIILRLSDIVADEFGSRPTEDVALDMIPLIMAAFEPDTQPKKKK